MNGNTIIGVGALEVAGVGSPNATATALQPACASGAVSANVSTLNNSQILDIHSIMHGITAISAKLMELKRSNEMLSSKSLGMARRNSVIMMKYDNLMDSWNGAGAGGFRTAAGL